MLNCFLSPIYIQAVRRQESSNLPVVSAVSSLLLPVLSALNGYTISYPLAANTPRSLQKNASRMRGKKYEREVNVLKLLLSYCCGGTLILISMRESATPYVRHSINPSGSKTL